MGYKKFLILAWGLLSCSGVVAELELGNENTVSFFAAGRQGYPNQPTKNIAKSMDRLAAGSEVNFVLLLGDNFYPEGVKSIHDPLWVSQFETLYDGEHVKQIPFYAVLGNHDHQGSIHAQIQYGNQRAGSGRWKLPALWYVRDFGQWNGRPLLRIAFIDSVTLHGVSYDGTLKDSLITAEEQEAFLRKAFAGHNRQSAARWQVLASHYPVQSQTRNPFSQKRIMGSMNGLVKELGIDVLLSSNDRLQQAIDDLSGALHISTNGGGGKLEEVQEVRTDLFYISSTRGFSRIRVTPQKFEVQFFDEYGKIKHQVARRKAEIKSYHIPSANDP